MNRAPYLGNTCNFLIQTRPSCLNGTINVEPLKFNASGLSKKDPDKEKVNLGGDATGTPRRF